MDSDTNFEVAPINDSCKSTINTNVIKSNPNTNISNNNDDINSGLNQYKLDTQYDNVDNMTIKPMYGGYKKFKINFRKKDYFLESNNEINAIKHVLNNKIYNKDHLLEIFQNDKNNISSMYIIKANYKNKFKKIH